jgi:hypothetical protein
MKIILNLVTLRSRHLIAPIIPIVCARLSTSPNPNSTISKRRISDTYNIQDVSNCCKEYYHTGTKKSSEFINRSRNLDKRLLESSITHAQAVVNLSAEA